MALVDKTSTSDDFIRSFHNTLQSIDPNLACQIEFKLKVQKDNLMSLVTEAEERMEKYEQIYPYIKEICRDQTINPTLYKGIEKVLNWALRKGRGKSRLLDKEIKSAWITYIILLSYAMIDKDDVHEGVSRNIFLKTEKGKIIGLTGNN